MIKIYQIIWMNTFVKLDQSFKTILYLQGTKPDKYVYGSKLVEKTKENKNYVKLFSFNEKTVFKGQSYSTRSFNS